MFGEKTLICCMFHKNNLRTQLRWRREICIFKGSVFELSILSFHWLVRHLTEFLSYEFICCKLVASCASWLAIDIICLGKMILIPPHLHFHNSIYVSKLSEKEKKNKWTLDWLLDRIIFCLKSKSPWSNQYIICFVLCTEK